MAGLANRVSEHDLPTNSATRAPGRAFDLAFGSLLLGFVLQMGNFGALYVGSPTTAQALAIVALAFIGVAAIGVFYARKSVFGRHQADNSDIAHARSAHDEVAQNALAAEESPEQSASNHEATRIRAALDTCKTNVMVADEAYNIIYMNNTMTEMMRAAEADLRKDIPALYADRLIGASIDTFHKNPAHQRRILEGLDKTIETDIKIGGHDFHLIVTPVFRGASKERIGTVVEWQDRTDIKAAEQVAFRLKSALDGCKTNVMVADEAYNIVYMNNTMLEMMRAAEADMRRDLPALDTHKLIGTNIDVFHKNPAHQRRILDALQSVIETDIEVGGRSFHLVVSPIADTSGKRLGTTVEWKDETAEKKIEVEIDGVVQAAVSGDLTKRVSPDGKTGFMLNLANSMNTLCGKVSEFVAGIKTAAQEVTSASAEISTSTTDLSQRTEEQAANLEETTASMEEISATVKKNAENAQQANSSAINTRGVADRGGEVVAKAVDAMARIEDSSGKIADIIGVIDEIARQTNLLALNAAVEAARAGDAGRGFAVVASEVRSLAQRSSQAAKDIKDLITNSSTQVKEGVELVNRAGAALTEIVESIKGVASVVSEIATASEEQATGIEQVNRALEQMDEVTQQNSALVEENAATAKTLEQQATAMNEQVAFFKLEDGMNRDAAGANAGAPAPRPRQPISSDQRQAVKRKVVEPLAGQRPPSGQRGGPVRRMQAAVATALKEGPEWKDF